MVSVKSTAGAEHPKWANFGFKMLSRAQCASGYFLALKFEFLQLYFDEMFVMWAFNKPCSKSFSSLFYDFQIFNVKEYHTNK